MSTNILGRLIGRTSGRLFGAPSTGGTAGGGGSSGGGSSGSGLIYPSDRYYLSRRYGSVPYGSGRAPITVFGDYCGGSGLVRRVGQSAGAPLVAAPSGLCTPDGRLIDGQTYLARRYGAFRSNGTVVPVVVPVCNRCGAISGGSGSGSGSGSSGSGSGSGSGSSGSGSGSGGGGGGTCCGCDITWPATLTATINVSCGYTVTVTMYASGGPSCTTPAISNLHYNFFDQLSGDFGVATVYDCDGLVSGGEITNLVHLYQGHLDCVPCGISGGYRWVLTYHLLSVIGGEMNFVEGVIPVTLASCAPLAFDTLVQNIECNSSPALTSCCADGSTPNCYVNAWTSNLGCDGGTVTFDISE